MATGWIKRDGSEDKEEVVNVVDRCSFFRDHPSPNLQDWSGDMVQVDWWVLRYLAKGWASDFILGQLEYSSATI